jgi:hypothetical protein
MERRGDNLEQASVQLFHKIVRPATKSETDWGLVCASSMAVDLAQFALGIYRLAKICM